MIRDLPSDLLEMAQWSGPQTIYLFFAGAQTVAFAIGWLVFLRSRNFIALAVVIFNLIFFADQIFIGVRRAVIIEVGFILVGGLWIVKGWVPPRLGMLGVGMILVIFINVVGDYRAATNAFQAYTQEISYTRAIESIMEVDAFGAFNRYLETSDFFLADLYNAALIISGTDSTGKFTLLSNYWNRITEFVPAQIFGSEFKNSLMIDVPNPMEEVYGVVQFPGSTVTGFADSFQAFWFFGAFVFFGFAYLMRNLHDRALDQQFVPAFLYLLLMKDALHAITHNTAWFVSSWMILAMFSFPVLYFARTKESGEQRMKLIGRNRVTERVAPSSSGASIPRVRHQEKSLSRNI
jgi:hypothetical protein